LGGYPIYIIMAVVVAVFFIVERSRPEAIARFEENVLATLLALITLVSFVQVIARYGFNTGWGGALEFTRILFAWMILFGMSYGVRTGLHLGIDAVIRLFPKPLFRVAALFGAFCVLLYAVTLIWADWLNYFGADTKRGAAFYWDFMFKRGIGLDDLKYPEWMQQTFGLQERVQRWVAYLILPVGLALLAFRSIQAFFQILTGKRELIIASHEAEDLVAENVDVLRD